MDRRGFMWFVVSTACIASCTRASPARTTGADVGLGVAPATAEANHGEATAADAHLERPASWAQPIERPGLPNLFRVSDEYYRGAQPTAEGLRELPKLGVKTIVNLRSMHSEDDAVAGLPLHYEQIDFKVWHAEDEDVVRFLRIVVTPELQPVFVHCQHGADRTGMMTAIYRVVVQGWSKRDAIREMTQGGFGFHPEWQNLVEYVQAVDVEALRREVGIASPRNRDASNERRSE